MNHFKTQKYKAWCRDMASEVYVMIATADGLAPNQHLDITGSNVDLSEL